MNFNKIDLNTWNRKNSYNHYFDTVPCTYSMTANIDISIFLERVKKDSLKFFPNILYAISHIVNKHEEFRMDLDQNGNVGYYDESNPCFTIFNNNTQTFTNVWTQYTENHIEFLENYADDMSKYQNDTENLKPIKNNKC